MAKIDGAAVQEMICRSFGIKPEEITPDMVFALVKIAKHCRLRCRSNVALHNWVKRGFPSLDVRTKKVQSKYNPDETYDALFVHNPALAGAVGKVEEPDEDGQETMK